MVAVGDGLGWLRGSARYRSDRDGLVSYYGPPCGSRGSGHVPRSALSFGATDPGSGQDSRSHVLRHSGVGTIPFAWQHRSPSGLEMLHLELDLKDLILVPQEHEILLWAVKGTISDLGTEIGHTASQAMREDLQKRKEILPVIHARLGFTK